MKSIAVFDRRGKRAPGVWPFYNYLRYEFNMFFVEDLDMPAERPLHASMQYLPEGIDYILWGFMPGTALDLSRDYLNRSGIPIIVSIGDVWQFLDRPGVSQQFWGLENIKHLIYKQRDTGIPDPHLERLEALTRTGFKAVGNTKDRYGTGPETFLSNATILKSPWGIDPDKYQPVDHDDKTLDVTHICTISNDIHHHTRKEQRSAVSELSPFTRNVYARAYHDILHRTKMLIVDNSGSGLTTQKYVEGAIHGCLLMGEQPYLDPDVFNDDTMCICQPGELPDLVRYYLANPGERIEKANRLKERVINNYHLEDSIRPILEALK